MKKIRTSGIRRAASMTGAFLLIASATTGSLMAQYGNRKAQECGDAVYRYLTTKWLAGGDWNHAGMFVGQENGKQMCLEVQVPWYIIKYDVTKKSPFSTSFTDYGSRYYGAYTVNNRTMGFTERRRIILNAQKLVIASIKYTAINAISPIKANVIPIVISNIDNLRCDGFVEYAYEKSGYPAWWPKAKNKEWSILYYPAGHNFAPKPKLLNRPDVQMSPWGQRGAPGFTPNPNNSSLVYPSWVKPPTYSEPSIRRVSLDPTKLVVRLRAKDESGIGRFSYILPGQSNWTRGPWQRSFRYESARQDVTVDTNGVFWYYAEDNAGNRPTTTQPGLSFYRIDASVGSGGGGTVSAAKTVEWCSWQASVYANPAAGYVVDKWYLNSKLVQTGQNGFHYTEYKPVRHSLVVTFKRSLPDLTIRSVSIAQTALKTGSAYDMRSYTKNIGAGTAASSLTGFYLSKDPVITTSDYRLGSLSVPALGAGLEATQTSKVTIPNWIGNYWIGAVADRAGSVTESNESNNSSTGIAVTIKSGDLIGPTGAVDILGPFKKTHPPANIKVTTSTVTSIQISGRDTGGSGLGAYHYRINSGVWSAWTPMNTSPVTVRINLPSGDGPKTVHVQLRDKAMNLSPVYGDMVYLDLQKPITSLILGRTTSSRVIRYNENSSDNVTQGVDAIRIWLDGKWGSWADYTYNRKWTLQLPDRQGPHTIKIQVRDYASLLSSIDSKSIYLDSIGPTGSVSIVARSRKTGLNLRVTGQTPKQVTITGGDSGGTGISYYRLKVGNQAWSGWKSWAASPTTAAVSFAPGEGYREVSVQLKDSVGNLSAIFKDSIHVDLTIPTGWVSIYPYPDSRWTRLRKIKVNIGYKDNIADGVAEVQFNGGGGWSGWLAASAAYDYPLTLVGPEGRLPVLAQFRDYAYNVSKVASVTVILDQTPPKGAIVVSPKPHTSSAKVGVSFTYADLPTGANSGVAGFQIDRGDGKWGPMTRIGLEPKTIDLLGGPGVRIVRVRYADHAGNLSGAFGDSTTLVQGLPVISSLSPQARPFKVPLVAGLTLSGQNLYPPITVRINRVLVSHTSNRGGLTVPVSELRRVVTRPGTFSLQVRTGAGVANESFTRSNPWPIDEGRTYRQPGRTSWTPIAQTADVDLDGALELFVSDPRASQVVDAFSVEGGKIAPLAVNPVASVVGRVFRTRFGDLDNDGYPDLVVLRYVKGGNSLTVFRNVKGTQGARIFQIWPVTMLGIGAYPADVDIDDVDGDGWKDIVVLEHDKSGANNYVHAFRNMGTRNSVGTFKKVAWFKNPVGLKGWPWGMDRVSWDAGRADDYVIQGLGGLVLLTRNSGATPSFTDRTAVLPPALKTSFMRQFIDFDHDGVRDLFITDSASRGTVVSYHYDSVKKVYVQASRTTLTSGNPLAFLAVGRMRSVEKAPAKARSTDLFYIEKSSTGWSVRMFDVSAKGVLTSLPHTNGVSPYNETIGLPILLDDLDGDGDADLLSTDGVATLKLFYGMGRQLSVDGSRTSFGSLGVHYYSIPRAGAFYILMIGTAKTKINMPGVGLWRLWPPTTWKVGPVRSRVLDMVLTLPLIPSPQTFYLQAVELPRFGTATGLRFSNMEEVKLK